MNLHEKLIAITAAAEAIRKDGDNKHFKYKFHSHHVVTAAVRDLLIEHKVATEVTMREGSCVVTLVNAEDPTQRVESALDIPRPDERQPQSTGVIMSYAVKLCYLKTFLLEDDSQDVETVKPRVTAGKDPAPLMTRMAQADREELDRLAAEVDAGEYTKDDWKKVTTLYKERIHAIDNGDGQSRQ